MIRKILLLLQILLFASLSNCDSLSKTRKLRHGFEYSADYSLAGENWGDTVPGAELCDVGKEQSPIELRLSESTYSSKME